MAKKNVLTQAKKLKADKLVVENRLAEAQVLYLAVCQADRLDVEAWVKLSVVQRRLGQPRDAEITARHALTLQPNLALASYALGAALHGQGALEAALVAYRRAIQLAPDFPDAHYLLATVLHDLGSMQEALVSYRRAIALHPDYFEALSDLGAALVSLGETEEATLHFDHALRLRPYAVDALCNVANLMQLDGRIVQARAMFEHALRIDANSTEAMARLAALLERIGETQQAQPLIERGLNLKPNDPALCLVAARLTRRDKRLPEAVKLLEVARSNTSRAELRGEISVLLGQVWDELGDAERAYPLFVEGNEDLAKVGLRHTLGKQTYLQQVNHIAQQFGDLTRCIPSTPNTDEPDPVFLIGFPRSGTTLLEQILDSHPAIQTLEEKPCVAALLAAYQAGPVHALAELDAEQIAHLRQRYFDTVDQYVVRRPDMLLVDKLPLNTVFVPLLWRVFPRARFILAIRHPCDVCLSCFMQSFAANVGMASFFSLEGAVRTYAKVMGLWQHYAQHLPLRYHRVRYEDLVADVPGVARALLAFLELDWDDKVLAHTAHAKQRETINTPSYHQVTQPIYRHAAYRWTRYAKEFDSLLPTLQPFISDFGYAMR